jgi:EmrB/QacA subfamily drug resistance transporter
MVALFLAALDQTIVATALPTIGHDLNDLSHLPWVVTAYLLTSTAVTPIYGKLSDVFGRRSMLLIAITVFLVGSVLCAVAPTLIFLILARAIQGLGGGGLISLSQTIIGDVISPRDRGKYQGYFSAVFVSSSIFGPVLGGFLSEAVHWSAIFWINLPIGILGFLLTNRILRRLPRHDRPHKIDVLGALLMVGATVALLLALTIGGTSYSWTSPQVLGLVALSILIWALFALRLARAAEPFFPLDLLGNRIVRNSIAGSFFGVGTMLGLTIYLPIYFESVVRISAAGSGIALIAFMFGTVTGANVAGQIMLRFEHYKRPIVALMGLTVPLSLVLVIWPVELSLPWLLALLYVLGTSLGLIFPFSTVMVQNSVPVHQLGTATAALNFTRSLGGAILIALYGAIYLSLGGQVGGGGVAVADPADLAFAFRGVFIAATIAFVATTICAAGVKELPLRGKGAAAVPATEI